VWHYRPNRLSSISPGNNDQNLGVTSNVSIAYKMTSSKLDASLEATRFILKQVGLMRSFEAGEHKHLALK
jgi:hypothetical protein